MDYAMQHNYNVKNAQLNVLIQEVQNKQTTSAAYPHIAGKAEFDNFKIPTQSFINQRAFNPLAPDGIVPIAFTLPYAASAGISGSQVLFDGSVLVALQARNTVMELARQQEKLSRSELRYNIFKTYNSVVVVQHQYGLLKNMLTYLRSMMRDMTLMRENGFVEKIDESRLAVAVNNAVNDSMRIGNLEKLTEQVLKYQIGMDINAPITLTDTNLNDHVVNAPTLVGQDADYDRVPEMALANSQVTMYQYNLKRYQYSALPSIAVFAAYGSNYGSDKFKDIMKFKNYWANETIGLQLNVPIFNGMLRQNQMKEARLNIERSKNSVAFLTQSLDFQSIQSKTSLRNALLQIQNQRKNLELANDVLELARKKYKEGVGANLEVTTAQNDYLMAQNNYFATMLDLLNAEAELRKALGLFNY
jgi:outer membrane protein TolC